MECNFKTVGLHIQEKIVYVINHLCVNVILACVFLGLHKGSTFSSLKERERQLSCTAEQLLLKLNSKFKLILKLPKLLYNN